MIVINTNAREVLRQVRSLAERGLDKAIAGAMDTQNELTAGHIVAARMSGPRSPTVLGRVTGTAGRSVRRTKARIGRDSVTSSIGSNVRYVAVHEFGFSGPVTVRAHQREAYREMEFRKASKVFKVARLRRRKGESEWDFRERMDDARREASSRTLMAANTPEYEKRRVRVADRFVKSHTRNVNFPARHMIELGIKDRAEVYGAAVSNAIVKAWNGRA